MANIQKHSDQEIIRAGEDGIGNLEKSYLQENKEIRVVVMLEHKEDGVLYSYDVFFTKTSDANHGIVWEFSRFIPVV